MSHEVTKTEATKLTKNTKIPIQETKAFVTFVFFVAYLSCSSWLTPSWTSRPSAC